VATIPLDNRLCALAQRVVSTLPADEPGIVRAVLALYAEAVTFTEGDLRGDLVAASRAYKEIDDIGTKADWDVCSDRPEPGWRSVAGPAYAASYWCGGVACGHPRTLSDQRPVASGDRRRFSRTYP
jgi:hypothetical protein